MIILFIIFSGFVQKDGINDDRITIQVTHPGKKNDVQELELYQKTQTTLYNTEFYADVESVVCMEEVCNVILVRMYWNGFGEYIRYEIMEGFQLEKGKDNYFTEEDYEKLENILHQKESPFKHFDISEIVTSVQEHGVDAQTGATALILDDTVTIKGAALTCYTLWHWANGGIAEKIRNISGDGISKQELINLIVKGSAKEIDFALEQIDRLKIADKEIVDYMVDVALNNNLYIEKCISVMENAAVDTYLNSLYEIYKNSNSKNRVAVLKSLLSTDYNISVQYLESLSAVINQLDTYLEVNLFFNLLEKNNISSEIIVGNLFELLNKDILIARRAYWYLADKPLSNSQKQLMNKFKGDNRDYL